MKSYFKKVIALALSAAIMLSNMIVLVSAEETVKANDTKTQYRYREKIYTTSTEELEEPWILYNQQQVQQCGETFYLYLEEDKEIDTTEYCVHRKVAACKYQHATTMSRSKWVLTSEATNKYGVSHPYYYDYDTTGQTWWHYADGYRYTCCLNSSKTTVTKYYYYQWSEWSEWNFTPIETSDDVEVEKRDVYFISYDATGGIGAPEPQGKLPGIDLTLSSTTPTMEGYVFQGWSSSVLGNVEYDVGATYTDNASITLYAIWLAEETFVVEGQCGDNLFWKYNAGTLTVYGSGDMYDYYSGLDSYPPWVSLRPSIKNVIIEDGATSIGSCAFQKCSNLTNVTMCNSLTRISDAAFDNCFNLIEVIIPDNVATIGSSAFYNCSSLATVDMGTNITAIGMYAFSGCKKLKELKIPYGIKAINEYTFSRCESLEAIELPNSLKTIESSAFNGSGLKSINLPYSVNKIGLDVFSDCNNLENITVAANNSSYSSDNYGVLFNKSKTELLRYPAGSKEQVYTIPDSVESINSGSFNRCHNLSAIVMGTSVVEIGSYAFKYCANLDTVYYKGTKDNWKDIAVSLNNNSFDEATVVYNFVKAVQSVTIQSLPSKLNYYIGESVNTSGLSLLVVYNDSSTKTISSGYSYSPKTLSIDGQQEITVSYGGKVDTFFIDVEQPFATSISLISLPTKLTYLENYEKLDVTGGKLLINYNTGVSETVELSESMVLGFDNSIIGSQTLTVIYDAVATTYTITVNHNYQTQIVDPTCTEQGYMLHTCTCGDSYKDTFVSALGHRVLQYNVEVIESYETQNDMQYPYIINGSWYTSTNKAHGSKSIYTIRALYDCNLVLKYKVSSESSYDKLIITVNGTQKDTISGVVSEKELIFSLVAGDAVSITYSKDGSVSKNDDTGYFMIVSCTETEIETSEYLSADVAEATCKNAVVCDICNQIVKQKLDHSYFMTVTAPTCTQQGYTTHTCKNCGNSYIDDYVEIAQHSPNVTITAVPATCTEPGLTEGTSCEECGITLSSPTEIAAIGHSFTHYVSNNDATQLADGTKTAKCDRCDATDTVTDTASKLPPLASGTCGDNLVWWLTDDGILTISGSGAMYNYGWTDSPWYRNTNIIKVVFDGPITSIGDDAFDCCYYLADVTIPDTVTYIGDDAFYGTALKTVNIPVGVTHLGDSAFSNSRIEEITLPEGLITIGNYALCSSSLKDVVIPSSVTSMGRYVLATCFELTTVTIMGDVEIVDEEAFLRCSNLDTIIFAGNAPAFAQTAFRETVVTVYYPASNQTWTPEVMQNYGGTVTWTPVYEINSTITSVTLRADSSGIYFRGNFQIDPAASVKRQGIAVSVYNQLPTADGTDPYSRWSEGTTSVLVSNILSKKVSHASNASRAAMVIYARAYVELEDGTYIYSDATSINLQQVVEAADTQWETLDSLQKTTFTGMYTKFQTVLQNWNLPNLKNHWS